MSPDPHQVFLEPACCHPHPRTYKWPQRGVQPFSWHGSRSLQPLWGGRGRHAFVSQPCSKCLEGSLSVTPWNPSLRRPFSWPHHFSPLPFRGHCPWPSPESHHPPPPCPLPGGMGADLQICSCSSPSPPTPLSREPLLVALGMGRAVDTAIPGARDSGPQAGAHARMTGASGWRTWVKEIGVAPRSLSPVGCRKVSSLLS